MEDNKTPIYTNKENGKELIVSYSIDRSNRYYNLVRTVKDKETKQPVDEQLLVINDVLADIKEQVLAKVQDTEIDVDELTTYSYSPAQTWGYVHNPEPAEENWDEEEEWCEKLQYVKECIEADGLSEYTLCEDGKEDEFNAQYEPLIMDWLEAEQTETGFY